MDKVPSNAELRRILTYMPIQGKALFLMLESSGMRIGEALQLKLGDVDLESDPVMVEIRGDYTKSGNPRRAFRGECPASRGRPGFPGRTGTVPGGRGHSS